MIVKICGITTLQDGLAAAAAGAHMLGYNFYEKSKRYIDPPLAADIIQGVKQQHADVVHVGIFVNSDPDTLENIMATCSLQLAQLCGEEPPALLKALSGRSFKAIRPVTVAAVDEMVAAFAVNDTPAILIDAYHAGSYGGSGSTGDWGLAARWARQVKLMLAGGLTPDNVTAAIAQVNPWGVDVASGVESAPGIKDAAKMHAFVAAATGNA